MAGLFDGTDERFPGLADHLDLGGDGAFGRHSERMGLYAHVGGEFALALSGAIIADGTVQVLVAGIVGGFGRGIARLGDGAAVELAGAVGPADVGTDDPLQVDLHGLVAKAVAERIGLLRAIRSCKSRMPSLSMTAVPKLSAILSAWLVSGQLSRTISMVAPLRSCATRVDWREEGVGLAMSFPFEVVRSGSGLCRLALRCGHLEPAERRALQGPAPPGRAEPVCLRRGQAALDGAREPAPRTTAGSGRAAARQRP
ncbi:hypothetical protein RGCCGE502_33961 (plasmid) [Rhizobium grahamii CCGE 502]|uniref:Uncharacterized protein n=1 Tax=Rhizobium grahamii CCGE 502 TaxID=990285 RepID=S3I285_9HYPH|nr:hypothetical protein RGCCGE502_33961 [Rhizobium grahamii CCGE 502]